MLALALFAASLQPALADDAADEQRRTAMEERLLKRLEGSFEQRALSGHPFVDPLFIDLALPTTHLESTMGAGYASVPQYAAADGSTYDLQWMQVNAGLDAGVRLVRFLGLYGRLNGDAGLGLNSQSAVNSGASASWAWELGANVRALKIDRTGTALGVRVQGSGGSGSGFAVGPGIEYLTARVEDGSSNVDLEELGDRLFSSNKTVGAGLSVNLAQALGAHFGVQASASTGYWNTTTTWYDGRERSSEAGRLLTSGGVALSTDLNPWAPLAMLVEYRLDEYIGLSVDSLTIHQFGGGLYINGLTNTIGLQVGGGVGTNAFTLLRAELVFRAYL